MYVIGDIHGHLEIFDEMIKRIMNHPKFDAENTTIVTVGDYIDRGPNSCGVVQRVIELTNDKDKYPFRFVALKGNHEDMLINDQEGFYHNGGRETLMSYGFQPLDVETINLMRQGMWKITGLTHYEFMSDLPLYYEEGAVCICHAGIDMSFFKAEDANPDSLIWSRVMRKGPHDYYKYTVHGHTPLDNAYIGEHVAYIDTGCAYNKPYSYYPLSCLYIPDVDNPISSEMELIQVLPGRDI